MRLATYTLHTDPKSIRIGALHEGHMVDLIAGERALNDGRRMIPVSMKGLLALGETGLARERHAE